MTDRELVGKPGVLIDAAARCIPLELVLTTRLTRFPVTAHWELADPAAVEGDDVIRRRAFREAWFTLKRRIELFAGLPLDSLDSLSLRRQLKEIGGA